jgi:hypothetical protein
MWKKWSWPNFKVLSRHFPGGTDENHKNLVKIGILADFNPGLPEYEHEY